MLSFDTVSGPYRNQDWRSVVFHFHEHEKEGYVVELHVNCELVATKKVKLNFKTAPTEDLELRLGQREIAGKIFSRYKVSLLKFSTLKIFRNYIYNLRLVYVGVFI